MTRTKLIEATGLRRTTLLDVVKRLIDRGHVTEVPNPRDGRSTLLVLTPEGREIYEQGRPAIERVLHAIDEALGGTLDEHEATVWRARTAVQALVGDRAAVATAKARPRSATTTRSGRSSCRCRRSSGSSCS